MPGAFILPIILGLPLLGAIFVMCTPKAETTLHRSIGLVFTTLTFLVSLLTLKYFNAKNGAMQLVYQAFTQIDREVLEQQGAGLGLTIAHCLTELNGGVLSLKQPDEGSGLEVELVFPVA